MFDIFKAPEYHEQLALSGFADIVVSRPVFLWLMPGRRMTAVAPER